jgi:hypothetical protein
MMFFSWLFTVISQSTCIYQRLIGNRATHRTVEPQHPSNSFAVYARYSAENPSFHTLARQFDSRMRRLDTPASWPVVDPAPSRSTRRNARLWRQAAEKAFPAGRRNRKFQPSLTCLTTPGRLRIDRGTSGLWQPRSLRATGYTGFEWATPFRGASITSDVAKLRIKRELKMLARKSSRRGRLVWSDRFFVAVSELHAVGLTASEIAALLNSRPANLS